MQPESVTNTKLISLLRKIDGELVEAERVRGCQYCGGTLHRSDYTRRPRGIAQPAAREDCARASFCCSREGCRKRTTPPSVRFFGRKLYSGASVVLVSLLRHGPTKARQEESRRLFGVSRRTLERWRQWWLAEFSHSRWWQAAKGLFMPPVEAELLPGAIFGRIQV